MKNLLLFLTLVACILLGCQSSKDTTTSNKPIIGKCGNCPCFVDPAKVGKTRDEIRKSDSLNRISQPRPIKRKIVK